MRQKTLGMLAIFLFIYGTLSVVAQTKNEKKDSPYFNLFQLPNPCAYLPAPPDTASVLFVDDFQQFIWGKSVRNTARGQQASWESLYGAKRMATVFSEAMGMTISKEETPAIYRFIKRAGETCNQATSMAKRRYMRVRPFARMNEHVSSQFDDEKDLRRNGSYPSGHTAFGWGSALAMVEVAPELQDTILRRGYEYGQSRIIVGAHWQSDVDAGRLAASAAIARMHALPEYQEDLEEAREEYRRIKGIKSKKIEVGYPKGERILDAPVDTASYRYYGDMAYYWQAKQERGTDRGKQAVADAPCEVQDFLACYTPCVDMTLSEKETPAIAAMVKKTFEELCNASTQVKSTGFRTRPFARLGESSAMPELNEHYLTSSSYPSSHSILGWGIALALVEVMPNCQNALLERGYEYGHSRVILGLHFASDVQAGRLVAAYTLACLHNDAEFQKLMAKAKKEYGKIKEKATPAESVSPERQK